MTERFVCARCGQEFESAEARCPKCLRKSTVQAKSGRGSASEIALLAQGDHSQSSAGRRAIALVAALTLSAGLGALVLLAWSRLVAAGIVVPTLAACAVSCALWIRAALIDGESDVRRWAAFGRRCALGAGLGVWALVAFVTALLATRGLSAFFAIGLGVVLFFGGVLPVLRWMQQKEEPAKPQSGKWR